MRELAGLFIYVRKQEVLTTDMKIRSARPEDAENLLKIYAYYVANTAVSFEYDVPTAAEFRSRIENTLQKYPYLVLEEDGIIQG